MESVKNISGVYKITNIVNNKCYIGSAICIKSRFRDHHRNLKNNKANHKFQNAWNKYGESSFIFEVLLYCEKEFLLIREQEMINLYQSATNKGYNISPTAGSSLGVKRSEEYKEKQRELKKGFTHTEEAKKKIRDASKGNTNTKGMVWSEEQKKRQSERLKGHKGRITPISQEQKDKQSKALKGTPRSEETKRKISESHKGLGHTPETKAKLSALAKKQWEINPEMFPQYFGKPHSEETKQKIRDSLQRIKLKKVV